MFVDSVVITDFIAGHILKEITGQNLQDYLKTKRIEKAKEFLVGTDT